MKIDRRSFLAFGIGGAAGTALSPLPWKLTDDSSIWSQMWPWTPVPARGEVTLENTTCTLCSGGCGIQVRKVGNRVVKIEGREGHPVNDGGICPLGVSGPQLLYGPRRVQSPLKRIGARGEGKWKTISWDAAVSEVAERLQAIREKGKAHQVAAISGSDRGTVPELLNRFLQVFGSPNFVRMPSLQDTYELLLYRTHGVRATAGFDVENADFVLSFGSGLIEGWGSPVRMFRANSKWKANGVPVVQIEPRLSNTAAKADRWVAVNPGSEGVLALGIAHVMILENLYDRDFVVNYTNGFDRFSRIVMDLYPPAKVSQIAGVQPVVIRELAQKFAGARRPIAIGGRGQGTTPGGFGEIAAVQALNALAGNINRPGGFQAVPETVYIEWPDPEMDDTASIGIQQERLDGAGAGKYVDVRYRPDRLTDALGAGKPYRLEALLISDANPCYSLAGADRFSSVWKDIPLVVSFSSYMDETAAMADLVLPNHIYLERYEDVPVTAGLAKPMIGLVRPVVAPQFDTMHTGDAVLRIAFEMGGVIADAFPWESYEECLEETLGEKWDAMVEDGFWADESFEPPAWPEAFETESMLYEFAVAGFSQSNDFLPPGIDGDPNTFPLILLPYDSMRLANGLISSPPNVIKAVEDTILKGNDVFVEINPITARKLGLSEGRPAKLATPRGTADVLVHLYEGVMPGIVALPRGLGHRENDRFIAGKGVNYNNLVGPVEDPGSGFDASWGIRAKLSKA